MSLCRVKIVNLGNIDNLSPHEKLAFANSVNRKSFPGHLESFGLRLEFVERDGRVVFNSCGLKRLEFEWVNRGKDSVSDQLPEWCIDVGPGTMEPQRPPRSWNLWDDAECRVRNRHYFWRLFNDSSISDEHFRRFWGFINHNQHASFEFVVWAAERNPVAFSR